MDHSVRVFYTYSIGPALVFDQSHQVVVVLPFGPIALPFQKCSNGRQTDSASLDHTGERCIMGGLRGRSAAVLNDVDVVTFA